MVYVDDIVILANDIPTIAQLRKEMLLVLKWHNKKNVSSFHKENMFLIFWRR